MQTCTLSQFMRSMKPWLDSEYIRKARLDDQDQFVLFFNDGVKNVYRIEDCTRQQLRQVIKDLREKGIPVEEE